ncbi:hypothetical protein P168DRAFT_244029 [Aspergillus campestris IBT 28561]|uniref:Uncharacterized protein n=1 Tax=Aspergillus campestris (strain IBT 28561) TaxID=1392248 RepID=A0A2I1CRV3_ASPC2|nr:uncharacterized protein P168DRAFT_244029 [Aspergillus campestris IBT 28561]PKY00364.1 hypothetical protein P168DRAFT_244029 [Aspergillus campestris IBT 28561]
MPCSNIDHVEIYVPEDKFEHVINWYKAALMPLQYREVKRLENAVGLGIAEPNFWIRKRDVKSPGMHVAFMAPDHETVWAFYDAALAVGGVSNGAPGLRPENNETYFAAYVLDPIGNNIEVVDQSSHEEEYR